MTRFIATAALTAVLLGTALPQAALAANHAVNSDGTWKVDAAKSSFRSGSATLSMERVKEATPGAGSFVVVSKGKTGSAGLTLSPGNSR